MKLNSLLLKIREMQYMRGIITSAQKKLQELINQNESDEKLVEN